MSITLEFLERKKIICEIYNQAKRDFPNASDWNIEQGMYMFIKEYENESFELTRKDIRNFMARNPKPNIWAIQDQINKIKNKLEKI